jgi:dihydropteroate synthase
MQIYKIEKKDLEKFFLKIGTDVSGSKIMSSKSQMHTLFIKDLHVGAANILKQDALSIGADLAVPAGTILAKTPQVDCVLIASSRQLEILSKKELAQPFGLKNLANILKSFIPQHNKPTKIMGIINANDDSFFSGSRFTGTNAVSQINNMINDGANIIDIGAVSSRPGSKAVNIEEELNRIKPICDEIKNQRLYEKVDFSIDSYTPEAIKYALDSGFKIVNDITGLHNDTVAKITSEYKASIVIMHMQGTPQDMQNNPTYDDVIIEVDNFFAQRIEKAKDFGIKDIILDVGIGFGKTLEHNLILLQNLSHFQHFGYDILLGASRKSMIDKIIPSSTENRLAGTISIHLDGIKKGASIIRCHDVYEHQQAIKVQEAITNI